MSNPQGMSVEVNPAFINESSDYGFSWKPASMFYQMKRKFVKMMKLVKKGEARIIFENDCFVQFAMVKTGIPVCVNIHQSIRQTLI